LNAATGAFIWSYTTDGPVTSSPAVADGKVYVGSYDGKVYCLNADTGAFIWNYTTGSNIHSSPAVADGKVYIGSYDDKVYCFGSSSQAYLVVRGSNNGIYCKTYDVATDSWGSWTGLPGSTPNSPAAAVINNELHLVVRGMTGDTIWHGYVNLDDSSFSGFTQLSGAMPSAPVMTGNSTHLCLVVRGSNSVIYYRFYEVATRVWGGWTAVPGGTTASTPAAVLADGALHVVVRGSSGDKIWYGSMDLGADTFSGWILLSGATPSPPLLTGNSTHLCLVVRGSNDAVFYRWYDLASEVWGGWTSFPYGSTPDVPAATIVGDSLQVVVRGMSYDYIWHGTLDLSTDEWSGWSQLDGTTPSKPVLVS
jgi:hypothetical protein